MRCERCNAEPDRAGRWCSACELQFDAWSRQYASDVVWSILAAGTVTSLIGMGLPFLGLGTLYAALAIFAGFGTFGATYFGARHRRRQQFLATSVPRAYLPFTTK